MLDSRFKYTWECTVISQRKKSRLQVRLTKRSQHYSKQSVERKPNRTEPNRTGVSEHFKRALTAKSNTRSEFHFCTYQCEICFIFPATHSHHANVICSPHDVCVGGTIRERDCLLFLARRLSQVPGNICCQAVRIVCDFVADSASCDSLSCTE